MANIRRMALHTLFNNSFKAGWGEVDADNFHQNSGKEEVI